MTELAAISANVSMLDGPLGIVCVRTSTLLTCFGVLSESLSIITVSLLCDFIVIRRFGDRSFNFFDIDSSSIVTTIDKALPFRIGLLPSE